MLFIIITKFINSFTSFFATRLSELPLGADAASRELRDVEVEIVAVDEHVIGL